MKTLWHYLVVIQVNLDAFCWQIRRLQFLIFIFNEAEITRMCHRFHFMSTDPAKYLNTGPLTV